jgi:hypothetical protein
MSFSYIVDQLHDKHSFGEDISNIQLYTIFIIWLVELLFQSSKIGG